MPIKITNGPTGSAGRFVIHGPPGVGKTSLSELFPGPVIHVDMEGSTDDYNFTRIECSNYMEVDEATQLLLNDSHPYKTVAYDTVSAWEKFIEEKILREDRKKRMADFSFGRGGILAKEEMDMFVSGLDPLLRKGMNVVLIAHSIIKRQQPPELTEGFDKWLIGVEEKSAAVIKRWAKAIMFVNYKVHVIETDERKTRGAGGDKRVICINPHPTYEAKNRRDDLPAEIPFTKGVWPEALNPIFAVEVTDAHSQLFEQFCAIVAEMNPEALKDYLVERGVIKPEDDAQAIPDEFLQLVVNNSDNFKRAIHEYSTARTQPAAA